MPYIVKGVDSIYTENFEDTSSDALGRWLSAREADGYRLVGMLPDHRSWDSKGNSIGFNGAKVVLHKEGNA